jgi:hypothetical protein
VVDYFGRTMLPLSEAISIGILEATVTCWTCSAPLVCRPRCRPPVWSTRWGLLAEMTPPVGFIELPTGRSEVEVFPVLR